MAERWLRYFLLRMRRRLHSFLQRHVRLDTDPIHMARGAAIGILLGMTPLIGLQIALAVPLAAMVRASRVMAIAFTFVSNPWTMLPLFFFQGKVAEAVIPYENNIFNRSAVEALFLEQDPERSIFDKVQTIVKRKQVRDYFSRILVGGLMLAPGAMCVGYLTIYKTVTAIQRRRRIWRERRGPPLVASRRS